MEVRQVRRTPTARALPRAFRLASRLAAAAVVLSCAWLLEARAQGPPRVEPVRYFKIDGRVSLPDDRPAARVRVRLSGRGGINRETYTNDNGRFEFTEVPLGAYSLTATSLADPALSASAEADGASRPGGGTVLLNITLRAAGAETERPRPGVVSAVEAGQVVPREAQKAFRQGLKLKAANRADEALLSFTRALEVYPDYFQALAERGDLRVARRELAEAASDFERALRVNARYEPALRGAGYCRLEARDFARAAEYLERAASAAPTNLSTLLLLGVANLELDRRDAARQALQKALKLDARRAVRAHIHLAKLHAREGRYRQAADELRLYLDAVIADPEYDELLKVEASWRAMAGGQVKR